MGLVDFEKVKKDPEFMGLEPQHKREVVSQLLDTDDEFKSLPPQVQAETRNHVLAQWPDVAAPSSIPPKGAGFGQHYNAAYIQAPRPDVAPTPPAAPGIAAPRPSPGYGKPQPPAAPAPPQVAPAKPQPWKPALQTPVEKAAGIGRTGVPVTESDYLAHRDPVTEQQVSDYWDKYLNGNNEGSIPAKIFRQVSMLPPGQRLAAIPSLLSIPGKIAILRNAPDAANTPQGPKNVRPAEAAQRASYGVSGLPQPAPKRAPLTIKNTQPAPAASMRAAPPEHQNLFQQTIALANYPQALLASLVQPAMAGMDARNALTEGDRKMIQAVAKLPWWQRVQALRGQDWASMGQPYKQGLEATQANLQGQAPGPLQRFGQPLQRLGHMGMTLGGRIETDPATWITMGAGAAPEAAASLLTSSGVMPRLANMAMEGGAMGRAAEIAGNTLNAVPSAISGAHRGVSAAFSLDQAHNALGALQQAIEDRDPVKLVEAAINAKFAFHGGQHALEGGMGAIGRALDTPAGRALSERFPGLTGPQTGLDRYWGQMQGASDYANVARTPGARTKTVQLATGAPIMTPEGEPAPIITGGRRGAPGAQPETAFVPTHTLADGTPVSVVPGQAPTLRKVTVLTSAGEQQRVWKGQLTPVPETPSTAPGATQEAPGAEAGWQPTHEIVTRGERVPVRMVADNGGPQVRVERENGQQLVLPRGELQEAPGAPAEKAPAFAQPGEPVGGSAFARGAKPSDAELLAASRTQGAPQEAPTTGAGPPEAPAWERGGPGSSQFATQAQALPKRQIFPDPGNPLDHSEVEETFANSHVKPIYAAQGGQLVHTGFAVTLPNGQSVRIRFPHVVSMSPEALQAGYGVSKLPEGQYLAGKWVADTPNGDHISAGGLIEIAKGTAQYKFLNRGDRITLIHETLHAARGLGLLSQAEWDTLDRLYGGGPEVTDPLQREENIARAYEAWEPKAQADQPLFARIRAFFSSMLDRVTNHGLHAKGDQVFEDIRSGKVWGRQPRAQIKGDVLRARAQLNNLGQRLQQETLPYKQGDYPDMAEMADFPLREGKGVVFLPVPSDPMKVGDYQNPDTGVSYYLGGGRNHALQKGLHGAISWAHMGEGTGTAFINAVQRAFDDGYIPMGAIVKQLDTSIRGNKDFNQIMQMELQAMKERGAKGDWDWKSPEMVTYLEKIQKNLLGMNLKKYPEFKEFLKQNLNGDAIALLRAAADTNFPIRNRLITQLGTPNSVARKALGIPSHADIFNRMRDPALAGAKTGDTLGFLRFHPDIASDEMKVQIGTKGTRVIKPVYRPLMAQDLGAQPSHSFPYTIIGRGVGSPGVPIPMWDVFRELFNRLGVSQKGTAKQWSKIYWGIPRSAMDPDLIAPYLGEGRLSVGQRKENYLATPEQLAAERSVAQTERNAALRSVAQTERNAALRSAAAGRPSGPGGGAAPGYGGNVPVLGGGRAGEPGGASSDYSRINAAVSGAESATGGVRPQTGRTSLENLPQGAPTERYKVQSVPTEAAPATAEDLVTPAPKKGKEFRAQLLARLNETGIIDNDEMIKTIGSDRPEYLNGVIDTMLRQRAKVLSGKLTVRDVAKAYYITLASIQSKGMQAASFEKRADFTLPEEAKGRGPLTAKDRSIPWVRPEEAASAALFTPAGQDALNNLEQGIFDKKSWDYLAGIRRRFGTDLVGKNFEPIMPGTNAYKSGKRYNFSNIQELTDEINNVVRNAGADRSKIAEGITALLDKTAGVGEAKVPFVRHMLGFGGDATIDAREINAWLTGSGDVTGVKTPQAELARDIGGALNSQAAKQLRAMIHERFRQLSTSPLNKEGLDEDTFAHVLHHWIWDAVNGEVTTHGTVYHALEKAQLGRLPQPEETPEAPSAGLAPWQERQKAHVNTLIGHRQREIDYLQERLGSGELTTENQARVRQEIEQTQAEMDKLKNLPFEPRDADYVYHSTPLGLEVGRRGLRSQGYLDSASGETSRKQVVWITEDDQGARREGVGGYGDHIFRVNKQALAARGLQVVADKSGEDVISRADGKPFTIPPDALERYNTKSQMWEPVRRNLQSVPAAGSPIERGQLRELPGEGGEQGAAQEGQRPEGGQRKRQGTYAQGLPAGQGNRDQPVPGQKSVPAPGRSRRAYNVPEGFPEPEEVVNTRASTAGIASAREALDLSALAPARAKKMEEAYQESLDKGMVRRADALADSVIKRPRALTDVQTASIVQRMHQVRQDVSYLGAAIEDAVRRGDTNHALDLKNQYDELVDRFDSLSQAHKLAGTEWARAGAARKVEINNYDALGARQRLIAADPTSAPTPQELSRVTTLTSALSRVDQRIAAAQQGALFMEGGERGMARFLKGRQMTPEEKLKAAKTRATTGAQALQARIDRMKQGIPEPPQPPRPGYTPDKELQQLQAQKAQLRSQLDTMIAERQKKTPYQWFAKWQRAALLSGIPTLGKLGLAAFGRYVMTPVEETVGAGLGMVPGIRGVAKQAPREGGLNLKAEAAAFTDAFTKATWSDAWDKMMKGYHSLDAQYGKPGSAEEHAHDPISFDLLRQARTDPSARARLAVATLDLFGGIHGAIKTPVQRSEFARSLVKRTEFALRNGQDVTDPTIQSMLAGQAYLDSKRAILMSDNWAVKGWQNALAGMERSGAEGGRITAAVARTALPIVKVPSNFAFESMNYIGGAVNASIQAAAARREGGWTPERADSFMRSLKKQSVGAGLMMLGFVAAKQGLVGGYWTRQQGKKGQEPEGAEPGKIVIGGVEIPHWAQHIPAIEPILMGATIYRAVHEAQAADMEKPEALGHALFRGGAGMAQELPFAQQAVNIGKVLTDEKSAGKYLGSMAASATVPQLLQNIATWSDPGVKRDPRGFLEQYANAVPILRKKYVPTEEEVAAAKKQRAKRGTSSLPSLPKLPALPSLK